MTSHIFSHGIFQQCLVYTIAIYKIHLDYKINIVAIRDLRKKIYFKETTTTSKVFLTLSWSRDLRFLWNWSTHTTRADFPAKLTLDNKMKTLPLKEVLVQKYMIAKSFVRIKMTTHRLALLLQSERERESVCVWMRLTDMLFDYVCVREDVLDASVSVVWVFQIVDLSIFNQYILLSF